MPNAIPSASASSGRRIRRVIAAVLAGLEAVGLAVTTVWSFLDAAARGWGSGGVAIAVVCLIATAWLAWTTVAILRRRSWARGSALTAQLLIAAVGIGTFEGIFAEPLVGIGMLVLAAAVLVLLFTSDLNDPSPAGA